MEEMEGSNEVRVNNKKGNWSNVLSLAAQFENNTVNDERTIPKAKYIPWALNKTSDLCRICQKKVFLVEKIIMKNNIFHKNCLKCNFCSATLNDGNYEVKDGTYFCVRHIGRNGTIFDKFEKSRDEPLSNIDEKLIRDSTVNQMESLVIIENPVDFKKNLTFWSQSKKETLIEKKKIEIKKSDQTHIETTTTFNNSPGVSKSIHYSPWKVNEDLLLKSFSDEENLPDKVRNVPENLPAKVDKDENLPEIAKPSEENLPEKVTNGKKYQSDYSIIFNENDAGCISFIEEKFDAIYNS